ncbi:MAG: hypothetical protein KDK08_23315 [Rhizobiaceae bacterium]|nr:hypothetical protein [Rhizobiaceae bacterium]
MAFQFAHISTFSRSGKAASGSKRGSSSTRSIFGELAREEEHCPHIEAPAAPLVLWERSGLTGRDAIRAVELRHDEQAAAARVAVTAGKAAGSTRALRRDAHTLRADVYSWHEPVGKHDDEWMLAWIDEIMARVGEEVAAAGGQVELVVLHMDEAFPHVHVLSTVPEGRVDQLHPGRRAKAELIAAGGTDKEGNRAYKSAMRRWQDDVNKISAKYGQARLGPGRRRLSRTEWKQEQASYQSLSRAYYAALASGDPDAIEVINQAMQAPGTPQEPS